MLAGFLLLLLLNISTWQCQKYRPKRQKGWIYTLTSIRHQHQGPLTFPFLALLFCFCCSVITGRGCFLCRQINTQQAIKLLPVRSWKMLLNQGLQDTPTSKKHLLDMYWDSSMMEKSIIFGYPYFAVDTKSLSSPPPSSKASSVLASPVDCRPITTHCTKNV